MKPVVSISGNIGCGKSTVLNHFRTQCYDTRFIEEPVDEWKPYLDAFYANPAKYALPLQLEILKSYNRILQESDEKACPIVVERSPFESLNVFAKVLHADKELSEDEYTILLNEPVWKPNYVVYLRSSPETCFERVGRRNRSTEKSGISLDYLRKIHEAYDTLYANAPVASVFVVDAEANETEIQHEVKAILDKIIC